MPYQPHYRHTIHDTTTYARYSRPRREHEDGTYEIHLIKSSDPSYIPEDAEAWPLYYRSIITILAAHPDIHRQCIEAVEVTRTQLQGRENRDIPPNSRPLFF